MDDADRGAAGPAPEETAPAEEAEADQAEFTFDQLDDQAKERARDWWREQDTYDEWWDYVYEDAVRIGALIGIEVGSTRHDGRKPGTHYTTYDIYFNLHVQGAGACYDGTLDVAQLNGCAARLAAEIGEDDALHRLAADGQALYDQIALRAFTRRLQGFMADHDNPDEFDEVGPRDTVAIKGEEHFYRTTAELPENSPPEIEHAMNGYVSGFADWIYHQLDDESMYRYSNNYVDGEIRNNGCLFDEFGSII